MSLDRAEIAGRWRQRTGTLLVIGVVPLSVLLCEAGPALADTAQPGPAAPATTDTIHIGSVQVPRPGFVAPQQADQIDTQAAQTQAALAQQLQSAGLDRGRADQISADTLGGAATGAAVGAAASTPIAAIGALIGGVAGLIAGVPFLPIGLLIGPVVGGAIGAAAITVPAAAAGAAIGAAAGAAQGATAPEPPR